MNGLQEVDQSSGSKWRKKTISSELRQLMIEWLDSRLGNRKVDRMYGVGQSTILV